MANNRIWLVHSSGEKVLLGSRAGYGWDAAEDLTVKLNAFFDECLVDGTDQDDFVLAMEDSPNPRVVTKWRYSENNGPLDFEEQAFAPTGTNHPR